MSQPQHTDATGHVSGAVGTKTPGNPDMYKAPPAEAAESGATPPANAPSTSRTLLLAFCLAFGNMVFSISTNSMIVMLDSLSDSLKVTENNLQWILNTFQLPFVSTSVYQPMRHRSSLPICLDSGLLHPRRWKGSRHIRSQTCLSSWTNDDGHFGVDYGIHEASECVLCVSSDNGSRRSIGDRK